MNTAIDAIEDDILEGTFGCSTDPKDYMLVQDHGTSPARLYIEINMWERGEMPAVLLNLDAMCELRELLTRAIERTRP